MPELNDGNRSSNRSNISIFSPGCCLSTDSLTARAAAVCPPPNPALKISMVMPLSLVLLILYTIPFNQVLTE